MSDGIDRFLWAQEPCYETVLNELYTGRKTTHWMWFVFPQVAGLGRSETSRYYAIQSFAEARAFLAHPVLGPRLFDCTEAVLTHPDKDLFDIFGDPDHWKFRSSMTLFENVLDTGHCFTRALIQFCGGRRDDNTLNILDSWDDITSPQ